MKRRPRIVLAASVAAASSMGVMVGSSAGTVSLTTASDSHGAYYLVNNGVINMQLYTSGAFAGKITSLTYAGQQMIGGKDIYYDIQGSPGIYLGSGETYTPLVAADNSYVMLSAEHTATATEPLDVTWNWIIRAGDAGFSQYLTYHHTTAMADYSSSENRLGAEFFNGNLFHYSSITDNFWGYQAAGDANRAQGTFITAETSDMRGIPSEYIKNYETKYDWRSTYIQSGGVTGIFGAPNTTLSTKAILAQDFGAWNIINPRAYESWNAGPTHPQTPVADGASLIPSPAASHFGGPGLLYTGNMDKAFGPFFTYFNTGSNITALRTDAEKYTTTDPASPYNLNTFYDTLPLNYYATTAQRGAVSGAVRLMDGSSLAGATIVLSAFDSAAYAMSPISQEYQRRAAGYNYWITPNADGTFNLGDVRPGNYRITVIKPGTYREATYDNITVTAGVTTNAGKLTWIPDISGKGVFQIGTFDRTAGEFRDGANFNNWISTFNLTKEFPNGVNYTVNPANPFNDTTNWSQNWPLDQINGTLDFFTVNFTLPSAPAANGIVTLTLSLAATEYINDFAVLVGGNRVDAGFDHTANYAPSTVRSGDTTSQVLYRKLSFPGSWLHAGVNSLQFHIVGGDLQYDAVRLDISNPGTFSGALWDGGTGNWSDAAHWGTQQYGYTNVNKGAATINGVANPEFGNDTTTTFSDGAVHTVPNNNAGLTLYYDAVINGGGITLDTSAAVQKFSLLSGTLTAGAGNPVLTVNDNFALAGGTLTGAGTLNALTTTTVNFASTIAGGFVVNATGAVTVTDSSSVTVSGAGSQWNTPGLTFGSATSTSLQVSSGGLINSGAGDIVVQAAGTLGVSGTGTVRATNLTNAGAMTSSGIVQFSGTFTNSGQASIGGTFSGGTVFNTAGALILNGAASTFTSLTVSGGLVQFASISNIGGSGANVMVAAGGAVSFAPGIGASNFLARLNTSSAGALALTGADSSGTLDFTTGSLAPFASMALGATGSVTYSGTYTPAGNLYRLGGGGGVLTFTPAIGSNAAVFIGNNGSSGTVVLAAGNSFAGTTTLRGGVLAVALLGNGGTNSPIGSSSSAAANLLFDGGTLQYTGAAGSTDRLFTITGNGASLTASGTGGINFTNTGVLAASGSGNRTFTLSGSSSGNIFAPGLSDPASGVTSVTKDGLGTWTLGAGPKTYSGDTTVLNGQLQLAAGGGLPNGAGKGNLNLALGTTFELNGQDVAINALNDGPAQGGIWASANGPGGGTLDNNSGTHTLTLGNGNAGGTFSGVISGGINVIKVGTGTQVLSGDNTYVGTTTISAGTLQVGVGGTPSSTGAGDGGYRGMLGSGNVVNNGTLVFFRGYFTTASNTISGTGTLKQIANAELALGTANTYTGPTVIGQGILNIGQGGPADGTGLAYSGDCSLNASVIANGGVASSIGASTSAASNLILDGGIFFYTGGITSTNRLFTVTQNGASIYANGGLTFSNPGAIVMTGTGDRTLSLGGETTAPCTFGSDIGDPASGRTFLAKDRSATWILAATASLTYSGDTQMLRGKLTLSAANQLPFGPGKGNVDFSTSTDFGSVYDPVLELNGFDQNINALTDGLTGYGSVDNNVGTHTLTLGNGDASGDFFGILSGNLNVVKTGLGTQTLEGLNTNTGGTTVNGGALIFSATSAIGGSGKNVIINNGALLGAPGTIANQTFINRIATSSTGVFAITGSDANNLDFSAAGANLANVSLGVVGPVTYSGTLTPNGTAYKLGGGYGTMTLTTPLTGTGNSLVVGPNGTFILTVANTYAAGTTINGGTVQFNTAAAIGGSGANVFIAPGGIAAAGYAMDQAFLNRITSTSSGVAAFAANSSAALTMAATPNVSLGAIGAATYSGILTPGGTTYRLGGGGGTLNITAAGALSGANSLVVIGQGYVNLTSLNTYTGATTIAAGAVVYATMANGLSASGIGQSSNIAANLVIDGGTLGGINGTDRLFTLTANGGTLDNTGGTGFGNTGSIALPTGASVTLTFTGTNTGHIGFSPALADIGGGFVTAINKFGSGKWTFGSSNTKTYSGDTHIYAGTLESLASNSLSKNSNVIIEAGAYLELHANSNSINGLSGAGSVVNDFGSTSQTLTIGANNGSGNFSGSISTAVNIAKTGSGVQTFTGSNSYSGATTVAGGTLRVTSGGAITSTTTLLVKSTGALTIDAGGAVTTSANASIGTASGDNAALAVNNAALTVNGDLNIADTASIATATIAGTEAVQLKTLYVGKATTASGTVTQTGGTVSTIAGGGDWRIGGGNSATDVNAIGNYNMQGGTFNDANNLQVGAYGHGTFTQTGGTVTVGFYTSIGRFAGSVGVYDMSAGGGTLNSNGVNLLIVGEQGTGTLNVGGTSTVNAQTLAAGYNGGTGTINQTGGTINATAGVLLANAGTGTFNLTGGVLQTTGISRGTGTGTFNFNGGTLSASADNAAFMQGLSAAYIKPGGAIVDSNSHVITIAQNLLASGIGGFTKNGPGIVTLTGTNTYSGGTTINAGILSLPNLPPTAASGPSLSLNAGGTFSLQPATAAHAFVSLTANFIAFNGGMLDLSNHDAILISGAAYAATANAATAVPQLTTLSGQQVYVTTGIATGSTYMALAGPTLDGHTVAAGDLVLRYGLAGDVTMTGNINVDDYLAIDRGFAGGLSGYVNGDFNHDGVINVADYALIDWNYSHQGGSLAQTLITQHAAEFGTAYFDAYNNLGTVPEPASLLLLGLGIPALACKSRRQRRSWAV